MTGPLPSVSHDFNNTYNQNSNVAAMSALFESRLAAVEEAVRRNEYNVRASQAHAPSVPEENAGNTSGTISPKVQAAENSADSGLGAGDKSRLSMSSLSVSRDQVQEGTAAALTDKLYARIQVLEEGMRVATMERNMAMTMLKELAGRVSGSSRPGK